MTTPAPTDPGTPPADPTPTPPPAPPTPPADPPKAETDWKSRHDEVLGHSREWEKRAKANAKAAEELEKLKASQMSDQEKAVEAAKAEGRTAAAQEYGRKLAAAEFRAAVAHAGLDLGEASDLIDVARFVDDKGDVDETAIKKAVGKLAKVTSKSPARSGGDHPGGPNGAPGKAATLEEAVAARYR